jgi:hypothetical protein
MLLIANPSLSQLFVKAAESEVVVSLKKPMLVAVGAVCDRTHSAVSKIRVPLQFKLTHYRI